MKGEMMSKYQEALDELFDNATNGEPLYVKQKYFNGIKECKDELQELVDKATPKKPNKLSEEESGRFLTDYAHSCSCCGEYLEKSYVCCPYCRQDIDWSEE